jgi:hypothetical protein
MSAVVLKYEREDDRISISMERSLPRGMSVAGALLALVMDDAGDGCSGEE